MSKNGFLNFRPMNSKNIHRISIGLVEEKSSHEKIDEINRLCNLVCVLENPNNIQNIASIMRTIDCLGIGKLYVIGKKKPEGKKCNVLKISGSASKWVICQYFDTTESCLIHLASENFENIATSPHTKGKINIPLSSIVDYFFKRLQSNYISKLPNLAIWFGSESKGLSPIALQACQICVQLPMYGMVESLNISCCVAIVLYVVAETMR